MCIAAYSNNIFLPVVEELTRNPSIRQIPEPKKYKISDEEVIYAGSLFTAQYGHFLIESLARLWYAKDKNLPILWVGTKRKRKGLRLVREKIFKLFGKEYKPFKGLTTWQEAVFRLLGLKNKHIFISEPMRFKKIHFPQLGYSISHYFHPEHAKFLASYPYKDIVKNKYVYISRNKLRKVGKLSNESMLEDILLKRGWEIVYPETMSVEEQVDVMQTAEICCFIEGSAQHTLMLANNTKTRFIALPRIGTNNYRMIAYHATKEYYNFELEDIYTKKQNKAINTRTLEYDLEIFQKYIELTENFTKDLDKYPQVFKTIEPLEMQYLNSKDI